MTRMLVNVGVGMIYMAVFALVVHFLYDIPTDSDAFKVGIAAVALCFPRIDD